MKAPVYQDKNTNPLAKELAQLRETITPLLDGASDELKRRALDALNALDTACKATVRISRGGPQTLGYGLDKAQKAIACDMVIAIVKQIKAERAW